MRRRRRKANGLWLPGVSDRAYKSGPDTFSLAGWGQTYFFTSDQSTGLITGFAPLVTDWTDQQTNAGYDYTESLQATEVGGHGYICKRILGNVWVAAQQAAINAARNYVVSAGIFVGDQDPTVPEWPAGVPSSITGTISSAGSAAELDASSAYSPDANFTKTRPWMWHRQWLLGNYLATGESGSDFGFFQNNLYAQSLKTGSWVDVKSRRHIKPNERMYLAWSVARFDTTYVDTLTAQPFVLHVNVRCFGALTRPKQGGNF